LSFVCVKITPITCFALHATGVYHAMKKQTNFVCFADELPAMACLTKKPRSLPPLSKAKVAR
jgi:hypothetical protein